MKSNKTTGILGLAGVFIFAAAAAVSILIFERGAYSPINCFVTELGLYTGGFMAFSSALVFNTGLMMFGILFGAFMVIYGLRNEAPLHTAVSFFGVLSGVLIAAQGLFSLNFYTYHYIIVSAFFISLFIMCVLYIVSNMLSVNRWTAPAGTIAAFLAGAASALSAVYMITGGMAEIFTQDASGIGRLSVIPFAVIGWAAYALTLVFTAALSVRMLEKEKPVEAESVSSPAGSGSKKRQSKPGKKR